jgi:cyclopropane fatty-acyl-phospholipid synthase-like methyltransferase
VLDIGCGTGEHALFFAEEGHEVWGIDSSPRAIEKAREKAAQRGLQVHFEVLDALQLSRLGRMFDTATDSGLFHTLSDQDRPLFVQNLAAVLQPGGNYFMLCFSDQEPGGYGPRRITQQEIRDSLAKRVVRQLPPVCRLREPHPGRGAPGLALIDSKEMTNGRAGLTSGCGL